MKYMYDTIICKTCGYKVKREENTDVDHWICPNCGDSDYELAISNPVPNYAFKLVDSKTGWYRYTATGMKESVLKRENPGQPVDNNGE
jgi:predicted amidophosphoribosyltransferase